MPSESIVPIDSPEIEEVIYSEDDTGNAEQEVLHGSSTKSATGTLMQDAVDNSSEMKTEEDGQAPRGVDLENEEDPKPERHLSDEEDL